MDSEAPARCVMAACLPISAVRALQVSAARASALPSRRSGCDTSPSEMAGARLRRHWPIICVVTRAGAVGLGAVMGAAQWTMSRPAWALLCRR